MSANKWLHTLYNVKPFIANEGMAVTEKASRIKDSLERFQRRLAVARDRDEYLESSLDEPIDMMDDVSGLDYEDEDAFDRALDILYDICDYHRVWVAS